MILQLKIKMEVVFESLDNTRYFYAIINIITSNNNEYIISAKANIITSSKTITKTIDYKVIV